ncbi:TCR/Tet family MFS transporter [bacterium AH-315-C07]|nr:TCR/Tet family MFS transporter [bacterium AH-315-C07]
MIKIKNRKAALGFIYITALLDIIGIGIIIPVVPTLIINLTGHGLSEASQYGGWLMSSYAIMQFLLAPLLGSLSDKYGRRSLLLLAMFGLGIDYLIHAFAPTIFWLFVGRILAGSCGASFTIATAYISDISTPATKAKNFGLIGSAFGLGFIIGPAIGGFMLEWGIQAPFFLAAGLSFANFLFGYFVLPESLPKEQRRNFDWKKANPIGSLVLLRKYPLISGLIVSFFLIHMAGQSLPATWVFFTELKFHWDEKMVGLSLALVGLLVAIVQGGLVGLFIKKLGEFKTIMVGMALWTLGLVLFACSTTGWMLLASCIPYCLGGVAGPSLQGIISNQVPSNEQGELQGAMTSIISVTTILSPLIMTGIFSHYTRDTTSLYLPGAPYWLASIFMLMGMIFTLRILRNNKSSIS